MGLNNKIDDIIEDPHIKRAAERAEIEDRILEEGGFDDVEDADFQRKAAELSRGIVNQAKLSKRVDRPKGHYGDRFNKTVQANDLMREHLKKARLNLRPDDHLDDFRPVTRGDCENGSRPCVFVGCKYHLYLDVNPETGSIKLNFPNLEPDELPLTCALDLADMGGLTLEQIGCVLNLTRERVRQAERDACNKFRAYYDPDLRENDDIVRKR